jgi:hypothetical protein
MDQKRREPLPLDGEIALDRFVALSHGIGLGEPRAKTAREAPKPKRGLPAALAVGSAPKAASQPSRATDAVTAFSPAAAFPPDAPAPASTKAPRRLTVARRLVAYSFDFILVCATLVTGLVCAAVWQAAETGLDPTTDWYSLAPVQWLSGFEVFEILVGVYAVFLAYALLFKAVAGWTLGESLLSLVRKAPKKRDLAPRRP